MKGVRFLVARAWLLRSRAAWEAEPGALLPLEAGVEAEEAGVLDVVTGKLGMVGARALVVAIGITAVDDAESVSSGMEGPASHSSSGLMSRIEKEERSAG